MDSNSNSNFNFNFNFDFRFSIADRARDCPNIDPVPAPTHENDPATLPDEPEQRPLRQRRATVESGLSHYDREGGRAMDLVPQTAAHTIAPSQVAPETVRGASSQVRERADSTCCTR